MLVLLATATIFLAQEGMQFPLLDKDPWTGCGPGSSVTRATTSNGQKIEETIAVKAAAPGAVTLKITRGTEEKDSEWKFTPFTELLLSDEGGYKAVGKSTKTVALAGRRIKTLVREFSPAKLALDRWRIATADEPPGGITDASWESEDDQSKRKIAYTCKGVEKIKIAGQDLECWRFDLEGSETKKKKRKLEGVYWLSPQVPGLLVRSRFKDTDDKGVTETTVEVTKFEKK